MALAVQSGSRLIGSHPVHEELDFGWGEGLVVTSLFLRELPLLSSLVLSVNYYKSGDFIADAASTTCMTYGGWFYVTPSEFSRHPIMMCIGFRGISCKKYVDLIFFVGRISSDALHWLLVLLMM